MADITLKHELAELYRERRMRQRNYPRWVAQGTLSAKDAAHQLACLEQTITRLKALVQDPEQLVLMGER